MSNDFSKITSLLESQKVFPIVIFRNLAVNNLRKRQSQLG